MTKQETARYYGLPAAVIATTALVFWLLNTAFVSRVEYDRDIDRIERKLDCALWNLPVNCRETMAPRSP